MLKIEFEPAVEGDPCQCCGGRTTRLTRFVYWNDDAYAVYYAMYSNKHPDRHVSCLISIGEWANDAPPNERCSVYVRIWADDDKFQVGVCEATESPWGDAEIMGRTLDRVEALVHPRIKDVFHITDHIVREDQPLIDHLCEHET